MITKTHHYYMLNPNPFPLLISFCSFNLFLSVGLFFKLGLVFSPFFSIIILSLGSFFWWFSFSGESNLEGNNSSKLESGIKMSMILFISSEVFFFFSFFWSYFHYFLAPSLELGYLWPPVDVQGFDCFSVPLINTFVLMTSGVFVTLSHNCMVKSDFGRFLLFLILTCMLGLFFTYLQFKEYESSFFSIAEGTFGTSFFMLTGFHGIHVLIGTIFLLTVYFRAIFMIGTPNSFVSFELASWYWHFVDVVWIFLYFFLYYLN